MTKIEHATFQFVRGNEMNNTEGYISFFVNEDKVTICISEKNDNPDYVYAELNVIDARVMATMLMELAKLAENEDSKIPQGYV